MADQLGNEVDVIQRTQAARKSLGANYTPPPPPRPQAPAPPPAPPNGASSFWGRITQVGIGKVNAYNLYKTNIEHQAAVQSNNKLAVKTAGKGVVGVGKAIAQPFEDVGKAANKNVIQPLLQKPSSNPGSSTLQAQANAQAAVKSGKVSPQAVKLVGQIQSASDKVNAYKIISDSTLSKEQVAAKLTPIIKSQSDNFKKALGDALQISSLVVGGGETKELLTGGTALAKGLAVNAAAGAAGNVGNTLSSKPDASGKELAKAGGTGAAFGAATALLSGLGGRALEDTKTIINKNPEVRNLLTNTATSKLIKKGDELNKPVKIGVQGGDNTAEKVGVRTPVHAGVKDISETDKINVRTPDQMSEKDYVTRLTALSKSYDKASGALKDLAPAEQKARQTAIDTQHQKALEDLNSEFTKPPLTKAKAPQKIASKITPAVKSTGGGLIKTKTQPTAISGGKPLNTSKLKVTTGAVAKVPSQSAVKIKASAVERGLNTDLADVREHGVMDIPAQAKKATDLVNSDRQTAVDIALGKKSAPAGTHPLAVLTAVENHAIQTKDGELLAQLANSPVHDIASAGGQSLRLLRERNPNSPVTAMQQIIEARSKAASSALKQPVEKAITSTSKEIEARIPKPNKLTWTSFVESIKC